MTTAQYVKKYNLRESNQFSHPEFVSDLTIDFISIIEWFKAKSSWQYPHFQECVKQIRQKWDSINNKTAGELPEKLWGYFWATVVVKSEEELFPDLVELRHEIYCMSDYELEKFVRDRGVWDPFSVHSEDRMYQIIEASRSPVLKYAYELCKSRRKGRNERERQQQEAAFKEWYSENQRRQRERIDWFAALLFNLHMGAVPTKEFELLQLPTSASKEEITKRYWELSLKNHPDKGGKQDVFVSIVEAKNKCLAYVEKKAKS